MSITYGNNIYLPGSPVVPMFLIISSITRANPAIVTVTTPNSFVVGQRFYFSVPFDYGMFQINTLSGEILVVDVTNLIFTINIDTIQFDSFSIPSGGEQPATVSPSGSRNLTNLNTNLKLEPFHSLNGLIGN